MPTLPISTIPAVTPWRGQAFGSLDGPGRHTALRRNAGAGGLCAPPPPAAAFRRTGRRRHADPRVDGEGAAGQAGPDSPLTPFVPTAGRTGNEDAGQVFRSAEACREGALMDIPPPPGGGRLNCRSAYLPSGSLTCESQPIRLCIPGRRGHLNVALLKACTVLEAACQVAEHVNPEGHLARRGCAGQEMPPGGGCHRVGRREEAPTVRPLCRTCGGGVVPPPPRPRQVPAARTPANHLWLPAHPCMRRAPRLAVVPSEQLLAVADIGQDDAVGGPVGAVH